MQGRQNRGGNKQGRLIGNKRHARTDPCMAKNSRGGDLRLHEDVYEDITWKERIGVVKTAYRTRTFFIR